MKLRLHYFFMENHNNFEQRLASMKLMTFSSSQLRKHDACEELKFSTSKSQINQQKKYTFWNSERIVIITIKFPMYKFS